MPRENPPTMSSRRVVRPARSSAASTRASTPSSAYTFAKKRRFSAAVNSAYRYKSWPSIPMRDRRSLPPCRASVSPYFTVPEVGCSSVAAIDSSVDLPAPLWPRSAVIVPASAVRETRCSARRRPNVRLTSTRRSAVKSTGTGLFELGVDPFERGHEVGAARRVRTGADAAGAALRLEGGEIREELLAPGLQLRTPGDLPRVGRPPRGAPDAGNEDGGGEEERDVPRPHRAVRQAVQREGERVARLDRAALPDDEILPVRRHVAPGRELRRGQLHRADLLRDDVDLRHLRRKLLLQGDRLGPERNGIRELDAGIARCERAGDGDALAGGDRVRRRALHHPGADRFFRQLEDQRSVDLHGTLRRVDDLQQVEHVQGVVADLDHEAALAAEDDHAGDGRTGGERAVFRGLLLDLGIGDDEHRADAADVGHLELLRLDPFPVDHD